MTEIETLLDNLIQDCIDYGRYEYGWYSDVMKDRDSLLETIKSKLKESRFERY